MIVCVTLTCKLYKNHPGATPGRARASAPRGGAASSARGSARCSPTARAAAPRAAARTADTARLLMVRDQCFVFLN